jgi:hypothetical protein
VNTQLRLSLVHLEEIGTSVIASFVTLITHIQRFAVFKYAKDKPQVHAISLRFPLLLLLAIKE